MWQFSHRVTFRTVRSSSTCSSPQNGHLIVTIDSPGSGTTSRVRAQLPHVPSSEAWTRLYRLPHWHRYAWATSSMSMSQCAQTRRTTMSSAVGWGGGSSDGCTTVASSSGTGGMRLPLRSYQNQVNAETPTAEPMDSPQETAPEMNRPAPNTVGKK